MSKFNLRRLSANQRGVATLEFAILMPMYVFFLIAMIEVYQFYRTVTIIDRTAYSIGNLVAEKAVLNDNSSDSNSNNVGIFWTIAPQVATPLDLKTNGTVIITVVKDAGNASPKIAWQRQETSCGMHDTSKLNSSNPLPSGFPFYVWDNTVVVEVFYHFSPFNAARTFWATAPLSVTLYRRAYFRPRFQNLDTLQNG